MSVLDGYNKYKRYIKTNDGYKLCSQWTSSNTVQMDDGNTLQTNLGAINGITDSLTATSSNIAASAAAVKTLNDSLNNISNAVNENVLYESYNLKNNVPYTFESNGYVVITANPSHYISVTIKDKNDNTITTIGVSKSDSVGSNSVFVKKGMKATDLTYSNIGQVSVYFRALC